MVELVFEGLDTHAKITLNEILIGSANNYHRTWSFDVKDILKVGDSPNTLSVYFSSAQ